MPNDFGFKRSRFRDRVRVRIVACRSEVMLEFGGCHGI